MARRCRGRSFPRCSATALKKPFTSGSTASVGNHEQVLPWRSQAAGGAKGLDQSSHICRDLTVNCSESEYNDFKVETTQNREPSDLRTSVMWSLLFVRVRSLAAEFWTNCGGASPFLFKQINHGHVETDMWAASSSLALGNKVLLGPGHIPLPVVEMCGTVVTSIP